MIHSPELGDLFAALAAFQSEVDAIPKGSTNPFYKSTYAALPDVVEAAAPLLTKNGLAVSQLLGHDDRGDTLTTVVGHKSGQYLGDTMHLRPTKDDPQSQGSATTYGRRYAYMAALGLVADEDDDGNHASKPRTSDFARTGRSDIPSDPPMTAEQYERLKVARDTLGMDAVVAAMDAAGVPAGEVGQRVSGLTSAQADAVLASLEAIADAA